MDADNTQGQGTGAEGSGESVESKARLQGWRPLSEYHGNKDKWVDAPAYLEKSEAIQPILRENNRRLTNEVDRLKAENAALAANQKEMNDSMTELKEFHLEAAKEQAKRLRQQILSELRAAKEAGDVDAEIQAQSDLSKFDASQKEAPPRKDPPPRQPAMDPAYTAWAAENPWFEKDQVKTHLAIGIAKQIRAEGSTLQSHAFYEEVSRRLGEYEGGSKGRGVSKVDSGSGGNTGSSNGRSYVDLPPDARAVCESQAKKFVGENKIFKTKAEWQKHYVEQYFGMEEE